MRPTTRWLTGGLLALAGAGCALPQGGGGAHDTRTVIDGRPVRSAQAGSGPQTNGRTQSRTGKPAIGAADGIAGDFLYALAQIDGYAPDQMPVRFTRNSIDTDPLVAALEEQMRTKGYAVRIVDDAGAADSVAHIAGDDAATGSTVHTLSVGQVQMRRSYRTDARGGWLPAGSLFVRGVDASGIRMDRSREAGERANPSPSAPRPSPGLVADAGATNRAAVLASGTAPLAIDAASGKPVWSGLAATSASSSELPRMRPKNLLEIDGSNFASVFDAYGNVAELILTFPNDSLVLGTRNKARIRQVLEGFDPDQDTFSIIGCSLGPTDVAYGNEALALGRANRVKEELLFAGVPQERIFEEGCWAMEAAAKFPSRGVVLTHKRRKDT